jgi:hypothetical protein
MEALSGDDLKFAVAILELHPNRDVIVDCGVKRIVVQHLNDRYQSRRFMLIRTDYSRRDFTWRHALYPRTAVQRVMKACRWAVKHQVRDFRNAAFGASVSLTCEVSGETITPVDCDVDHVAPRTFDALVASWLRSLHILPEDVALVPVVGYECPDRWEDTFLEENWKEYHRTHAHLRVISARANRSILRKSPCQQ